MESSDILALRFTEVTLNGKWIANTNICEQIQDLTWKQATCKIGTLNTIAALIFHLDYYIAGLVQVFEGGGLDIRDKYSFDMEEINNQQDWENLKNKFIKDAERFSVRVGQMSYEQINSFFVDEKYGDYRRNINGMIEHCYYHFGQITMLKKMVLEQIS